MSGFIEGKFPLDGYGRVHSGLAAWLQDDQAGHGLMKHDEIWRALDMLAADHGLSPSGLARRSGLDPTTFNVSKRRMPDGRARWPSTESLAKVLASTGASLDQFAALIAGGKKAAGDRLTAARRIPLIGFAQAGNDGFFDDAGFPVGGGWDEVTLPDLGDSNAYALEVSGESMEPVYRDGDQIIVSPSTPIRKGDRVVLKTIEGEVMTKVLLRRSAKRVELKSLNPEFPDPIFDLSEIVWLHRIIWASQ